MPADFPVTELWRVIAGQIPGRQMPEDITLFDSVGFAIEDFSTLRLVRDLLGRDARELDLVPSLADPKNLFGALMKEAAE
jgi:ornithine cyclodeaminase